MHEIFFDQAIERAEALDRHYAKYGTTVGPLHGLPISLKDQFHVKGNDTSMGFIGWLGTYEGSRDDNLVHKINSQIVEELLSLGAILYCKVCPVAFHSRLQAFCLMIISADECAPDLAC